MATISAVLSRRGHDHRRCASDALDHAADRLPEITQRFAAYQARNPENYLACTLYAKTLVVQLPPAGDSLPGWEILSHLARKLGATMEFLEAKAVFAEAKQKLPFMKEADWGRPMLLR